MEEFRTSTLDFLQIFEENCTKIKDIVITQQALITDCAFRIETQSRLLDEANTKFSEQKKELFATKDIIFRQEKEISGLTITADKSIISNKLYKEENEKIIEEKKVLEKRIETLVSEKDGFMQLRNTYYSSIRNNQIRICKELTDALSRLSSILFDSQFFQSEFKSINILKDKMELAINYLEDEANADISVDEVERNDFSNKMYDWVVDNIETISKLFIIYFFCRISQVEQDIKSLINACEYVSEVEKILSLFTEISIEIISPIPFFDSYNSKHHELSHYSDISQININYTNSLTTGKVIETTRIGIRYADKCIRPLVAIKV
jgi:hypothetical protein